MIKSVKGKSIEIMPKAGSVTMKVDEEGHGKWDGEFTVGGARRMSKLVAEILEGKNRGGKKVPALDGKHVTLSRYDNQATGNSNVLLECFATVSGRSGWSAIITVDKAEKFSETIENAVDIAEHAQTDEEAAEEFDLRRAFIAL
jgi:hypothetical protein